MSKEIEELRRKLNAKLREAAQTTMYGTVTSYDEEQRTCKVQVGGIVYDDVLLYATEKPDLKGFVCLPKVGSIVLVVRVAGSERLYVALRSEIDKVIYTCGDEVTMTCDGDRIEVSAPQIVFNGGDLGGLINIEQITTKINEIIDALNTHTHQILPGGVATVGSATSQSNAAPVNVPAPTAKHPKVKKDDYEDQNITH